MAKTKKKRKRDNDGCSSAASKTSFVYEWCMQNRKSTQEKWNSNQTSNNQSEKKKSNNTYKKKDLKAMSESNRKKKRKAVHTVFSPTMNVCVHVDAESGGSSPRRHRRRAATIVGVHRRGKYKGGTRKKKRSVVSAAFHCNLQAAGHVNFTRPSLGFFSFPPLLILALFHPLRDGGRRLRQRHRGWRCAIQSEVTQQHPT